MQTKRREIILWVEGIGFSLIIALGWAAEIFRVPHVLFSEPETFNWARPVLKTVVVLCVWAAVNYATRRVLQRLHELEEYLRICAWCRKIDHDGQWMTIETYFGSAFATQTTHGICPECTTKIKNQTPRAQAAPP